MLLTPKEAAKELNVSLSHLRYLIRAKKIPFLKLSERVLRFERDQLLARIKRTSRQKSGN
jgi:excisionase family DNA binding protein